MIAKTLRTLGTSLWMLLLTACRNDNVIFYEEEVFNQTQMPEGNIVSPEVAKQVSAIFWKNNIGGFTRSTTAQVKDIITIRDESGEPTMYVINYANDEGFVIVGVTRNYYPILAFSEKGYFDIHEQNMPLGVAEWIREGQEIIKHQINETCFERIASFRELWKMYETSNLVVRAVNTRAGDAINWIYQYQTYEYYDNFNYAITRSIQKWNSEGVRYEQFNPNNPDTPNHIYNLAMGLMLDYNSSIAFVLTEYIADTEYIAPLLTTTWGQYAPYNSYTPNNYPTGCVATAMTQVMKYHRWPNSYDWNLMKDSYKDPSTEIQKNEVGRLMYNAGVAVGTKYDIDGSGAQTSDVPSALKNSFQYSSNVKYSDYDFSTVVREIKARRPVILNGKKDKILGIFPKNGHAWVCDGYSFIYQKSKQTLVVINGACDPVEVRYIPFDDWEYEYSITSLHMNWGWNGEYNAWFAPYNYAITKDDGSVVNYKYDNGMVINIQPNK